MGCAWFKVRTQNVQGIKILIHFYDHAIHQLITGFFVFQRAFNDFVVHVGDVAHIG